MKKIRFIDLFSGMGGIRLGLERAAHSMGIETECVLTSEIKAAAIKCLKHNHPNEVIYGDIFKLETKDIRDFDILLAGFPCQPFSAAGVRQGFLDPRGTLFFEVERILMDKKPKAFILENVEGLVNHDKVDPKKPIGRTLETILNELHKLGYNVSWKVLNSKDFGLAQDRKRIYIVGNKRKKGISLNNFPNVNTSLSSILNKGLECEQSDFIDLLLKNFSLEELQGKSIKDKRGGETNIHSWDIEVKGPVSTEQKELLNQLFKERRKKKWAEEIGIDWMDGMPLTCAQISTFYRTPNLLEMLEDLVEKGYLVYEHPKKLVKEPVEGGGVKTYRLPDTSKPKGYNIVAGKLSFEISKILAPTEIAPTLVATDMQKLYVVDGEGLRKLSLVEGLRLFGYPDTHFPETMSILDGYDLLGNTVAVPVIQAVATRVINSIK